MPVLQLCMRFLHSLHYSILACHALAFLQAIARDVGPREMTVRQMLHSAALRSRQPSITAAAADHLVRMSLSESPMEGIDSIAGISPRTAQQGVLHPSSRVNGDVERGLPLESVGSTSGGASFRRPGPAPAAGAPTGIQQQQHSRDSLDPT
jgi:hypothetical protein